MADAAVFVPLVFFGVLLVPALPRWGAALIAGAVGAVFVPVVVSWRTARADR
ncbi:hypothetical protein ACFPIJ_39225 [Dactylosporangium cerinum]|uniref:Uncharacterized protein n=1 Tax=Dactylosporangium cerinum TaxID=1434730 RepID=A0ABV9W678_9ACTN